MEEMILGIDIGGTSIKIGCVTKTGKIIYSWEIPTNTENNGASIVTNIRDSIIYKLEELQLDNRLILGIGVGAPGFINEKNGKVYEAINIGWKDLQLATQFEELFNVPVFVDNDANIAALGEYWQGMGKGTSSLIVITLGTGIGSGIIINGAVLNGVNGTAGEIGHIIVDSNGYICNCGRIGCLETIASATGIVRQALDSIADNPKSALAAHYNKFGTLTSKDVFELAKQGDIVCSDIIERAADMLGMVIANTAIVVNPSKVLIGGGVSKSGQQFLLMIEQSFRKYALARTSEICEIRLTGLGNHAGIVGAAFLVKQGLKK